MIILGLENKYGNDEIQGTQIFAEVQLYKEQLAYLENQLTALVPEEEAVPEFNPIQWLGSDTDLVDLFLTLKNKHFIKAASKYEIFKQLVRHFINKDGNNLKSENLKKEAKARELSGNSPFDKVPENDKAKQNKKNG
jgi:hypothetical protein